MAQPYCGNRSGEHHQYGPRWLPDGLGLLRHPPRLLLPLPSFLPVLREEDYEPEKFFYYAAGCSDLYIRAGRYILANNRVDALVQIAAQRAPYVLEEHCSVELRRANRTARSVINALVNESAGQFAPVRILEVSGSGCLNAYLAQSMRMRGWTTLVLNFEPPGLFTRRSRWDERKAEIMLVGPHALYSEDGKQCESAGVGCLHCRSSTPRARQACRGWMHHHGPDAKDWRSVTPEWRAAHPAPNRPARHQLQASKALGLSGAPPLLIGRQRARRFIEQDMSISNYHD